MLLHHLDNLDSKMECMRGLLERDRQIEGEWTGYSSALDRTVLKKSKFLGAPAATPATPPATSNKERPPAPSSSPFASKLSDALRGNS
jgi:3'-5' exoribonuclease